MQPLKHQNSQQALSMRHLLDLARTVGRSSPQSQPIRNSVQVRLRVKALAALVLHSRDWMCSLQESILLVIEAISRLRRSIYCVAAFRVIRDFRTDSASILESQRYRVARSVLLNCPSPRCRNL